MITDINYKFKKAEMINPLWFLALFIFVIIFFFFAFVISDNIEDKACAKLGYDKYYKIGGKIGICEKDNGDFIDVKMICKNTRTYQILLGECKCEAIKIKKDNFKEIEIQYIDEEIIKLKNER